MEADPYLDADVTTMSKFLCMGMPLPDVVAASTVNAAMALTCRSEIRVFLEFLAQQIKIGEARPSRDA